MKLIDRLYGGARHLLPPPVFSSIAVLLLAGCALTLTPSPPDGATGIASPVTIGVTSNTEIVNSTGTGPVTALTTVTLDGSSVTLSSCNQWGSACNSAPQPVGPGPHTLIVTAPVVWPAFYAAPNNGATTVSCNVPYGGGYVTNCGTITASSSFSVACVGQQPYPINVTNAANIPVTDNQPASWTYQLAVTGGCPPYKFPVLPIGNSYLPAGLSLSNAGLVSGTTTVMANGWTFDTPITVTDALGKTGTAKLTFIVTP